MKQPNSELITSVPYQAIRDIHVADDPSAPYGANFLPVSLVVSEDLELGVRNRGIFFPHTEVSREGGRVVMDGILAEVSYEREAMATIVFDKPVQGVLRAICRKPEPKDPEYPVPVKFELH